MSMEDHTLALKIGWQANLVQLESHQEDKSLISISYSSINGTSGSTMPHIGASKQSAQSATVTSPLETLYL